MGLLNHLIQSLKFWWNPRWEQDYSYKVLAGDPPLFLVTRGKYAGYTFMFTDVKLRDADDGTGQGVLDFLVTHHCGETPREIVREIFMDFMKRAIDRHNQLHREVINDQTEDSGTDYFEEPADERRVRPPRTSVPKE